MHLPHNLAGEQRERLQAAQRAVDAESRLVNHTDGVRIAPIDEHTLEVRGEVDDIAYKRLLLHGLEQLGDWERIDADVRLHSASAMGDEEIRAHLIDSLTEERSFFACGIAQHDAGRIETVRPSPEAGAELRIAVQDGVVRLEGQVWDSSLSRLAEVLAYWVGGTRHVDNQLIVSSPGPQDDGELRDVLQLALEKNPLLEGSTVRARVDHGVATLEGFVPADDQRGIAEHDAWYVPGVVDVHNELRSTHVTPH